jgi:hypothetical protein
VRGVVTPGGPDEGGGAGDGGGGSGADQPSGAPAGPAPKTSGAVLSFGQLSKDPKVIGTNVVLAVILLIVLLATSTIFNETLSENRVQIQAFGHRITAPFRALGAVLSSARPPSLKAPGWLQRAGPPLAILGLTGLIYTFNESNVGFDGKTALLFTSLVIAIGLTTYVYEGGEAIVTQRRFGIRSDVRLFPVAIAIAVGFVLVSRLSDFEAPIMYGFVASATVLAAAGLQHRDSATAVLFPALALLALSVAAWLLLVPLREMSEGSDHWWDYLPGETAALLFVGGVEGLLFVMLPLRFLDGEKIWRWYRWFWFPLFIVPAFLFSWVILNPEAVAFDALIRGRVLFVLSIVGAYAASTFGFWAYFRFRGGEDEPGAHTGSPSGTMQEPSPPHGLSARD